MAHRNIHYEAAFEDYLRAKSWPCVVVDEAKRAAFAELSIKSFDFIVYSASGPNLLVDVKGRKFPDLSTPRKRGASRAWENWITRQDAEGLAQWEKIFGSGFVGMLVFAYWLQGPPHKTPFEDVHVFRKKHYAFVCIPLADYLTAARPRSSKWQTLSVSSGKFSAQARDIASML